MSKYDNPLQNLPRQEDPFNKNADLLTTYLGVTIHQKPVGIPLTPQIIALIMPHIPDTADLNSLLGLPELGGKYFPEVNAYIFHPTGNPSSDQFIELHENFEAYLLQTDSRTAYYYNNLKENEEKIHDGDRKLYESFLVNHVVKEGLCNWAAAEVMILQSLKVASPGYWTDSHHLRFINDSGKLSPTEVMRKDIEDILELYDKYFTTGQATTESDQEFESLEKRYSTSAYQNGHFCVTNILHLLWACGFEKSEALDTLIKNPPASVDELFQSTQYVERILVERNTI